MATTPYPVPEFLKKEGWDQERYKDWLDLKAAAHLARDRRRLERKGEDPGSLTGRILREAIHLAVTRSDGRDPYTGEALDWSLVRTFKNKKAKKERHKYWESLALMPSVDHRNDDLLKPRFQICSLKINQCKSHLSDKEFIKLCRKILECRGWTVINRVASGGSAFGYQKR